MKAMLLAAGRGERLKPLTDNTPKPLISVGDYRLIEYSLFKLKMAGVKDVVINLHYLARQIMDFCGDGSRYGLTITYSYEEECLGTGGGIARVLPLFEGEPFLLLSADIWSEADLGYLTRPLDDNLARLVMVNNPAFHPGGDYGVSETGLVSPAEPHFTYAGIALLHPDLFQIKKTGAFSLADVFNPAIENGSITADVFQGPWFNVGTQRELDHLQNHLSPQNRERQRPTSEPRA